MVKNIIAVAFLFFLASIISGCAYESVKPGEDVSFLRGFLPAESWADYKKRTEAGGEEVSRDGSGSKITHLPGDVVRYNSGNTSASPGVEVFEENSRSEDRLVITPFSGGESPGFNKGRRDEKKRARILKQQNERQRAVDLAREDALNGTPNYEGVSGKYIGLYNDEFERTTNTFQRRDQQRYRQDEYRRGQESFRQDHPEYAKSARLIDQIKEQAISDAWDGYYRPPADGRFVKDYKDAYEKEFRRLEREYRLQHDRRR